MAKVTTKDVENCKHTYQDLALLARKLGYKRDWGQLDLGNGATASDLFDFFEDNPGAIEAVLNWLLEQGCDSDGNRIEDPDDTDEEEDEEEEDDTEEGV